MTNLDTALNELRGSVGCPTGSGVAFKGTPRTLNASLRLSSAGAVALGAAATAADAVWQHRGGRPQSINIDMRHAAAAVRTYSYMGVEGEPARDSFRGMSGFYRCGDGRWIRTHCNFPHHEAALLRVLNCPADKDAVGKSASEWSAQNLEDATLEAGGCAYMVRSIEEWDVHPHATTGRTLPPLEILKIGDAATFPMSKHERPLGGIRVLDLTRIIAGPMIGRTLAEHGAEVLRIASPKLPFIPELVIDTGYGKRSAHIDLETKNGREQLRRLINDADVIVNGYRQGSLAARGFGPDDIAREFPGMVYVSLSAWGHVGPWAMRRGYDSLLQCATGWAAEHGGDDTPALLPVQAIDYASGYLGAFGVMEALRRRATEGGSWLVRLSLLQTRNWIDDFGRATPSDDGNDDLSDIMLRTESPFGTVTHLGPTVQMSETPPHWKTPPVPLGTHDPEWTT